MLTDFQNFYSAKTSNLYNTTHLTLGMSLRYLGKLHIWIFCTYSADIKERPNCIL